MRDVQIEDRLRQALHAEADALPFTITAEDLRIRLHERRRTSTTRMSILSAAAAVVVVVGVGAAILADRGDGPFVGSSGSPVVSPTTRPSPSVAPDPLAELDSYQALEDLVTVPPGATANILLRQESLAAATGDPATVTTRNLGTIASEGGYLNVVFDCEGPESFTISWKDASGSTEVASITKEACGGPSEGYTAADIPGEAVLEVVASERTSWRLIVYEILPERSTGPTLPELPDHEQLAERRVQGENVSETFDVLLPSGTDTLILQAACTGNGSITVTDQTLTNEVACGTSANSAFWDAVPPAAGELTVTVTHVGDVESVTAVHAEDFESNAGIKFIPPRSTLAAGGETALSELSCGLSFSLAEGGTAADSCGPGWPVIPADRAIMVPAGTDVTFTIPGWTMTGLTGEVIATQDLISTPHEDVTWAPLVDMDGGSDSATFGAPVAPGDWTIKLSVNAERAGDTFGVPYVFRLVSAP